MTVNAAPRRILLAQVSWRTAVVSLQVRSPLPLIIAAALLPAPAAHAQSLVPGGAELIADGTSVSLTQAVRNVGDDEAAASPGALTGPGVSDGGPKPYEAIPTGEARENTSPFTFTVPAEVACGTPLDFRLALAGAELPLRFVAGAGAPRAFAASDPVAVPDAGSASSAVTVADLGAVRDVNVRIDRVAHEFAADLTLELLAPDGTAVTLAARQGGNGQDYAGTLFDDQALAPVDGADAPFAAQLRPQQPLSALDGKSSGGEWKLRVTDAAKGETGTIEGWSLELIATDCAPPAPGGGGGGTTTGDPAPGSPPAGGSPALGEPTLALTVPTSARTFAARGLLARVSCAARCAFRLKVLVDARTARRLRLRGRTLAADSAIRTLTGAGSMRVRLLPRYAATLRRRGRGARLTIRAAFTDGRTITRTARLTRR